MTEPVSARERVTLPSLTSLRWYAAVLVFACHLQGEMPDFGPLRPLRFGYSGVTFFFVLSGFVLTWSAGDRVRSVPTFYWRRFARIYPAHVTVLAAIVLFVAVGAYRNSVLTSAKGLLLQLTLTQAWWPDFRVIDQWSTVSWSLSAEVFFYLCFPIVLATMVRRGAAFQRTAAAVGIVLAVMATVVITHSMGSGELVAYANPLVRLPEFVVGIWLALEMRRGSFRRQIPLWSAVAVWVVLGVVSWRMLLAYLPMPDYLMLPAYVLLIVAAVQRDQRGAGGLLTARWSVYLGELSFAFYLVHLRVTQAVFGVLDWHRPWTTVTGWLPLVTTLVAAAAVAAVLHELVEKPAQRALTRMVVRPRAVAGR